MKSRDSGQVFLFITAGRLLIFLLLFVISYFYPDLFHSSQDVIQLSWLLGAAFFLTIIWIMWFKGVGLTERLKSCQIVGDVLLASIAIWLTGGIESHLSFLYSIAIVTACILGPEKMGGHSTLLSILLYALICVASYDGSMEMHRAFFTFFLNMGAFGIIALLAINLTKRLKHAEKRLEETTEDVQRLEEIQRHLANSMKAGLITMDLQGNVLFYNMAAIEILGSRIENSYGRRFCDVIPEFMRIIENGEMMDDGDNGRRELTLEKNGEEQILGVSYFCIEDQYKDKRIGQGIIFQDITQLKAREERLRMLDRLAALGEMAAGLAHEIRNPLASISGAAEFLEQSDMVLPEGKRLVQIICREAQRLTNLASSFLLYGRPEKKQSRDMALLDELSYMVQLLSQRKGMKDIAIEMDVPKDIILHTDVDMFRQVILNILLNAAQAIDKDDGKICIKAMQKEGIVEISIEDNGCGMDEQIMDKVFDPFFTTKASGTGLGLSIVHRIVSELGGEICLSSQKGKGTTCLISLPMSQHVSS